MVKIFFFPLVLMLISLQDSMQPADGDIVVECRQDVQHYGLDAEFADPWETIVVEAPANLQDMAQPLIQHMDRKTLGSLPDHLDGGMPCLTASRLCRRAEAVLEKIAL